MVVFSLAINKHLNLHEEQILSYAAILCHRVSIQPRTWVYSGFYPEIIVYLGKMWDQGGHF